jgi:aspartate racemase
MKTIGLIGGTGWVSTVEYYRTINHEVNKRLGGLNAAKCILFSLNYAEVDAFNRREDESGVLSLVLDASEKLRRAGAECLMLCANTLHQFAGEVEGKTHLPLIHVATATANEIARNRLATVGLLGTRQTMERQFYQEKLRKEGIEVIVPVAEEREFIHRTIMIELIRNRLLKETKNRFLEIIESLHAKGAEGIVLGCTEIPLLIAQEDIDIPLFNTLAIHSMAAVDFALARAV